jgi:hypothetical protein
VPGASSPALATPHPIFECKLKLNVGAIAGVSDRKTPKTGQVQTDAYIHNGFFPGPVTQSTKKAACR